MGSTPLVPWYSAHMTMRRRRLMLGIGAALLVGGWGATRYVVQQQRSFGSEARRERGVVHYPRWDPGASYGQAIYIGGFVSMAIGAGLIGFAVLRPTNRKDE